MRKVREGVVLCNGKGFLIIGLCLFGFVLHGADKSFELELLKVFKTGAEYEVYKRSHPEVFGVGREGESRIRLEGDRLRFYDAEGNLICERRVYRGKEVFEGEDRYGRKERFRLYAEFKVSPKGDLVVECRWKAPPPPSEEPAWRDKVIIYNERGEITGEIDSLSIIPYILPESKYIIGINGGEGWAENKVYIYDRKGKIMKTIEIDIEYPEIAYVKISNDGGYAVIVYRDAIGFNSEIVLIDKDMNIIWKKKWERKRLSEAELSSLENM